MHRFRTQRLFAFSPSVLFSAFRDAAALASWWGPDGFRNEFEIFDFRPGGDWVFTMIGPDGRRYPNTSVFDAIETDRLVRIRHCCAPEFVLTVTLQAHADATLLEWQQDFADEQVALAVRHIVEPANEQNLDRLAVVLGASA